MVGIDGYLHIRHYSKFIKRIKLISNEKLRASPLNISIFSLTPNRLSLIRYINTAKV